MTSIKQNINQITLQIENSVQKCGRRPDSVQLLAVSKTKPIELLEQAMDVGQRAFGENYVQEGIEKIQYFQNNHPNTPLEWHFIGPIQSNKTRPIAEHFDWVHSVDRLKIAQRLNEQRPDNLGELNVLIQVNISAEESKSGTTSEEVMELAAAIHEMPNLTLRGLMSIPANVSNYNEQLAAFTQLASIQNQLRAQYPQVDTLSMGMSSDMDAAIEAGSTMVRIGTAIFGTRD
ncbi:YggS family pyridoxal phosphate-dependent enzyme [Aliivibrio sp. S3MY1]|uniref:YggS family pyridoxal phosphate-dependent enzyme n=1 Tax=unclassified Aliivibrio TaxID=2645654 RepID=UPI002378158D|nr:MULTISPECIES: YggS family pyridoxal phosphate-dependent enzyme [unclassified Aliivibrio]MDD9195951.1 YggS family pyridoxal phosphate-dependent enzyme [Aliivibrio sp. S3MY1]MDD9199373.1 YggS family pyridoxal phosphate-dependent enzyme [Aliivibrio sp. S2MY1]